MPAHGSQRRHSPGVLFSLTLTAVGVVYGDIGTSPLYTIRECFFGSHSVPPTHDNVLGVLSLIIYALLIGLGIIGAALLYGDGMIRPAITVLSAVEGLRVATPLFEPYVLPVTVAIL